MKIITWNCNMAFRKKAKYILDLNPDVLIIPECEHPEKLMFTDDIKLPYDIFWYGTNVNKGLGVFSFSDFRFKLLRSHNPEFKNIIPLKVYNDHFEFILFAIWANNPLDVDGRYVTQIWKAIEYYEKTKILKKTKTILIGDFNSNTIWDRPKRIGNHSDVVAKLNQKKIFSTYHTFFQQTQGSEEHSTLFMYRHHDKPYHIDYCFVSSDFMEKVINVEVGTYDNWAKYSDHTPLSVTFDFQDYGQ